MHITHDLKIWRIFSEFITNNVFPLYFGQHLACEHVHVTIIMQKSENGPISDTDSDISLHKHLDDIKYHNENFLFLTYILMFSKYKVDYIHELSLAC